MITITKWLTTNNIVSCFALTSSFVFVEVCSEITGNLSKLLLSVSPITHIPASKKPIVAIKYATINSDPKISLNVSEYCPTNLGPKTEPKTENHTARERAVALNSSFTIKMMKHILSVKRQTDLYLK